MDNLSFNLFEPNFSYMFGFMQADGHLTSESRGRGKMRIEISEKDKHILEYFKEIIPVKSTLTTRNRDTNFKKNTTSFTLIIYDKKFRDTLIFYGVPSGKKSNIIHPSKYNYSKYDYWRGIIDADGSLGLTVANIPFLSLVTASEELSKSFCDFLYEELEFRPNISRNSRDGVYNITITNEKCQKITKKLYYTNSICLNRKRILADKIKIWKRPENIKIRLEQRVNWSKEEKKILLENSIDECYIIFNVRKKTSVRATWDSVRKK